MGVEENECNVLRCSPSGSWSARAVSTGTAGTGSAEQKSEFQDVHSVLLWALWKKIYIYSQCAEHYCRNDACIAFISYTTVVFSLSFLFFF